MFGKNKDNAVKKTKIPLKDRTLENDIKFRGVLSYRYVRILAWVFLILIQIGMVVKFQIKIKPESAAQLQGYVDFASFISEIPLALFLLANFAFIFQSRHNWRGLLIFYGGIALGLYIVANTVILHYGFGIAQTFFGKTDFMALSRAYGVILSNIGNIGYIFNIFIDLFLCSLIFFFMFYTPKGGFKNNTRMLIFRLFVLLPILYEVGAIIIKFNTITGNYQIPFFLFFLLTSKPPLMFVAFLFIVFGAKYFEYRRVKRHSEQFAAEHAKTNAHSLKFSILISSAFFVAGILDLFAFLFFAVGIAKMQGWTTDAQIQQAMLMSQALGFGNSLTLIIIIPVVMFFSYNKKHENKKVDKLIPIAGIALIIFVYVEGFFQVFVHSVGPMIEKLREILDEMVPQ